MNLESHRASRSFGKPNNLSSFTTTKVPVERRVAMWEEQNRRSLIPLRVSSFARESISSTMLNLPLGSMRLTAISGNDHVIERSEGLIKRSPADTVLFCLLNKGDAFFYGSSGMDNLVGSEAVVYDSDVPFMYGFKSNMEQYIFEIPREDFHKLTGQERLEKPIFFGNNEAPVLSTARRLFASTVHSIRQGYNVSAQQVGESFQDIFGQVMSPGGERSESAYYRAARDYIYSHAHLPHLSVGDVAHAVGVSERHLARAFAAEDQSVGKFISDARLELAYKLLRSDQTKKLTVTEIAQQVGFIHSSHFSRVFRAKYQMTPRDVRNLKN